MDTGSTAFSRRTLLKGFGAAGALAVTGTGLAACSTGSTGKSSRFGSQDRST